MKSQTKLTLPTIASISTIIVTTLIGTAIISQSTSALTYQDSTDVKFTFNPTININLSSTDLVIPELTSGSSSDSNEVTVSVSTNTGYGYYLSATAGTKTGNTSLNNTLDSSYKFTNLTANAPSLSAMPDNSWGYSYSTDNGTTWVSGDVGSAMTGYNGLPLDNDDSGATGIKLVSTDSFTSSSSIKFKIGAKSAPTQAAGTYTNTVNFYAVANTGPATIANSATMQEVDSKAAGGCPDNLTTDQAYEITDSRDGTIYHVARLADGNCWLLDNIALDLTNSTVLNNMDESNTNASNLSLTYLKNGGGTASERYATSAVSDDWSDDDNSGKDPLAELTDKNVVPTDDISQTGNYKVGGFYNYCAATAGNYCFDKSGTASGDAMEDICPKGWRMPTSSPTGEFSALANVIYGSTGSTSDAIAYANYRSALHLPLSGNVFVGEIRDQGSRGFFWSSTWGNYGSMYDLFVNTTNINPSNYNARSAGHSVRCILK